MDHTGSLGGRHAGADRPGAGLLFAGGEVGAQTQQFIGGPDQALQAALAHPQARQKLAALLLGQFNQLRFHLGRDLHAEGTLLLRQGLHGFHEGIAAGQVVLTHIGGIDDRLGGEQAQGPNQGLLLLGQDHRTGGAALLQHRLDALQGAILELGLLAGAQLLLEALAALLHLGQIGKPKLQVDDLGIAARVHRARNVNHVIVLEAAHHVHDGVHLADVGQELVAQALALAGALHQAGDVHKLHPGGDDLLRARERRKLLQAPIGHGHHARIGLDRAEGEIGSGGLGVGHQSIEEGGFAHVGQPHDSGFEHGWNLRGPVLPTGPGRPGFGSPPPTSGRDRRDWGQLGRFRSPLLPPSDRWARPPPLRWRRRPRSPCRLAGLPGGAGAPGCCWPWWPPCWPAWASGSASRRRAAAMWLRTRCWPSPASCRGW